MSEGYTMFILLFFVLCAELYAAEKDLSRKVPTLIATVVGSPPIEIPFSPYSPVRPSSKSITNLSGKFAQKTQRTDSDEDTQFELELEL